MDIKNKRQALEEELKRLEKKLEQLKKDTAEIKGGSRYGDEYGEIQLKVYSQMIAEVKEELSKLKP